MNPPKAPPRRDFLGKPAPPGYVAGVGRGATGFTTRSDIGPAHEFASRAGDARPGPSGAQQAARTHRDRRKNDDDERDEDEDEDLNETNYDEFTGYAGSLFSKRDPYEEDDEEADKIYEQIDKHLDERGKALREAKTRQELELYRQKRPKIQQQFTDLKASLSQVSEAEWMNIPEVGDARNRKQRNPRQDKFTPLPDSLLAHQAQLASGGEKLVYLDPKETLEAEADDDSDKEPSGASKGDNDKSLTSKDNQSAAAQRALALDMASDGRALSIGEMSDFRGSYMSLALSKATGGVKRPEAEAAPKTDPRDYLTNLQSMTPSQITNSTTIKEYRKQFKSLRSSNPTFPNAWIASVRLEEAAGNQKKARKLILAACEQCPLSADIWCEAVRLHPKDVGRTLLGTALLKRRELQRSLPLWLQAAELESDESAKRRVFEKARKFLPKSAILWKKSVELERSPEDARAILREAVECCPDNVELWLELARLEPYEKARVVLSDANKKIPTSQAIWLAAAKLEESAGNRSLVASIVGHALKQLRELKVEINRNEWLDEAAEAAKANFPLTCAEIVGRTLDIGVAPDRRLATWLEDARSFELKGAIECARSIFSTMVADDALGKLEQVWLAYVDFERRHGTSKELEKLLKKSLEPNRCAKSEKLWLELAKERSRDLQAARQTLAEALDANPDSERIILEAVELECSNSNHSEARRILTDACKSAKTAQLVRRAARLEWSIGNFDEASRMLSEAVSKDYPRFADFYLMLGQLEEQRRRAKSGMTSGSNSGGLEEAKKWLASGLKQCPKSIELWVALAELEERTGLVAKARSRLSMGRLQNPKVPKLWLEAAKLEVRAAQSKLTNRGPGWRPHAALTLLAEGIRECKGQPGVEELIEEQERLKR